MERRFWLTQKVGLTPRLAKLAEEEENNSHVFERHNSLDQRPAHDCFLYDVLLKRRARSFG
jgi:hypothetical protein